MLQQRALGRNEMNNYPPGMTKGDWKHIDGEQHHKLCIMNEDYVHDCCKEAAEMVRLEFRPPCWALVVGWAEGGHFRHIRIDFCPFCGADLGGLDCLCPQLAQDMKDEEAGREQQGDR